MPAASVHAFPRDAAKRTPKEVAIRGVFPWSPRPFFNFSSHPPPPALGGVYMACVEKESLDFLGGLDKEIGVNRSSDDIAVRGLKRSRRVERMRR